LAPVVADASKQLLRGGVVAAAQGQVSHDIAFYGATGFSSRPAVEGPEKPICRHAS